ncbi:MAG: NAD(P)-dependent oxidoreductase [Proteobacteria bacterium]|nr:MAG: NAD(P)-dependent oxidoreductase [Pseudomonadota bacterium]
MSDRRDTRVTQARTTLLTGAASGIGRATAVRLASEGAQIFACDVDERGLAATVETITAAGGTAVAHRLDVADPAACRAAVAAAVARFGKLDVLCNIAGVMSWGHASEISEAEWNRVVAINLSGPFFLCRAAIPHLLATRGTIVNMASAAGTRGQAYTLPYSVTKAGVISLTQCLAVEYGKRGLRVVAVAPGGVKTALTSAVKFPDGADMSLVAKLMPLMPLAEPEEIAAAVAYLVSDEARFVNGAVLAIDGGQTAG